MPKYSFSWRLNHTLLMSNNLLVEFFKVVFLACKLLTELKVSVHYYIPLKEFNKNYDDHHQ